LRIGQPHERPLSGRLTVKVPARSILPMIGFRDALCITHNPVNCTVSQGREGPARFAGCRITLRTPVGIIRKAASCSRSSLPPKSPHEGGGRFVFPPCLATVAAPRHSGTNRSTEPGGQQVARSVEAMTPAQYMGVRRFITPSAGASGLSPGGLGTPANHGHRLGPTTIRGATIPRISSVGGFATIFSVFRRRSKSGTEVHSVLQRIRPRTVS
jgi:hypothetical protein